MGNKQILEDQIKVFGMQNMMLEADLIKLENTGIEIGHIKTILQDEVVDVELFDYDIRKQAAKMADFYSLYYCLENTVRRMVYDTLYLKYGPAWWDEKVPSGVKTSVKDKQEKEKDAVVSIRSDNPLCYTNFGELIDILNANWIDLADTMRSKKAMQQTLWQFNQLRNVIAHSCELSDDDITRFKLLIKDWLRIQV